ncbi:unnamed protein product [Effrenium voratum]|nr:unnamed protein product [Effrenium voratum]
MYVEHIMTLFTVCRMIWLSFGRRAGLWILLSDFATPLIKALGVDQSWMSNKYYLCQHLLADDLHPPLLPARPAAGGWRGDLTSYPSMTVEDVKLDTNVGLVSASRPTATCSVENTFLEASDLLQSTGRTAAVILDEEKAVLGVLTENDMLLAFVEGVNSECTVGEWLHGGEARLPSFLVSPLTLRPDMPLVGAAARMADMTHGDFACHHLLVCNAEEDSAHVRLLSALDIARVLAASPEAEVAKLPVTKAMKLRSDVPTCFLAVSLGDALDTLHSAKQNCVLAVPSALAETEGEDVSAEHALVGGAITPADALRAVSERVDCCSLSLAKWLHRSKVSPEHRFISSEASLCEAAAVMCKGGLHHLLVQEPARCKIVGVLSALDIVRAIGSQHKDD